jgi:DNA-binding response OmpR family regulator
MVDTARKIVVVEDDPFIGGSIVRALVRSGFEVELATDGVRGVEASVRPDVALVVLDLMLPELDGLDVIARIRARSPAPILVVSARTELRARVAVFEAGAVDYLPKPFFVEELLVRIQARLAPKEVNAESVAESFGELVVDWSRREVRVDGSPVALTPTELNLLRTLTRRPGRAYSRGELSLVSADPEEASLRHLDAHLARLRKKLGRFGVSVVTVWGHGYRFDPPRSDR